MPLASVSAENAALSGMSSGGAMGYLSAHISTPGTTGAAETSGGSYARQAVSWGSPASGAMSNTNAISQPIAASTTISYAGTWSAVTSGTYAVGIQLGSSVTFGTAGNLTYAIGALQVNAN